MFIRAWDHLKLPTLDWSHLKTVLEAYDTRSTFYWSSLLKGPFFLFFWRVGSLSYNCICWDNWRLMLRRLTIKPRKNRPQMKFKRTERRSKDLISLSMIVQTINSFNALRISIIKNVCWALNVLFGMEEVKGIDLRFKLNSQYFLWWNISVLLTWKNWVLAQSGKHSAVDGDSSSIILLVH